MKRNKKIICVIIFILVLLVIAIIYDINARYFIGSVTQIVKPSPGYFVVEVIKTNASYRGLYYIYSNKKLNVGDIVKVTFIRVPYHDVVITLSNPKSFSHQDYYVRKIR